MHITNYISSLLRLYRVACIDPGGESAEQSFHFFVAVIQQEERRTGARVFILSGAVGNDPLIFFERKIVDVIFKVDKRNGHGSRGVTFGIRLHASHIDEDG